MLVIFFHVKYKTLEICLFQFIRSKTFSEESDESIFVENPDDLEFNDERMEKFVRLIQSMSSETSKEELIKRLRLQLINRLAKQVSIKKVAFAQTCTKLTIELLSNVAIGKGAHISTESVWHIPRSYSETRLLTVTDYFCFDKSLAEENRLDGLVYLRPMRYILIS